MTCSVIQLLECSDEQLCKTTPGTARVYTLTKITKEEAFEAIQKSVIRKENTMITMVVLNSMRQECDKPQCAFGPKLRGQISTYKITQRCPGCKSNVIYTEAVIEEALCRSLEDSDIHMDLLGEPGYNVGTGCKFVEVREAGKDQYPICCCPSR